MTTTAKAIETNYAGCRFRSRLEARWAVFFDTLSIPWEYEPQGYIVGDGHGTERHYLPDFYLPSARTWVEVKGETAKLDPNLLAYAIIPHQGLPLSPEGGDAHGASGCRLLILGPIPRVEHGDKVHHDGLGFHKGDVFCAPAWFTHDGWMNWYADMNGGHICGSDADYELTGVSADATVIKGGNDWWKEFWKGTVSGPSPRFLHYVEDAYRKARSARFEHGECG